MKGSRQHNRISMTVHGSWFEYCIAGLGSSNFGGTWVKYKYFSNLQVLVQVQVLAVLDGIKYFKYVFNQVQVSSTLVTNNSTVSLYLLLPSLIHLFTQGEKVPYPWLLWPHHWGQESNAVTVVKFQFHPNGFQLQFPYFQFHFQVINFNQFWNLNWAAIQILELNWLNPTCNGLAPNW